MVLESNGDGVATSFGSSLIITQAGDMLQCITPAPWTACVCACVCVSACVYACVYVCVYGVCVCVCLQGQQQLDGIEHSHLHRGGACV
jgi:hypothetical protein